MPWYEQMAWFPLCGGLTIVGLVASWFVLRRRGATAGIRLASWSLLPLAAYLTGVIPLLWDLGTAVAAWALKLVINPLVWAGIALAGVSLVGFVVSGALKRRRTGHRAERGAGTPEGVKESTSGGKPAVAQSSTRTEKPDDNAGTDDLSDVEDILRRRGIT